MGCHQIVASKDAELQKEVEKLGLHWKDGRPVEWVRIHKVAGFVYFPHKRHVQTGLACQQCHGAVQDHDRGRPGGAPDHGLVRVLSRRAEGSARLRGLPPLTERGMPDGPSSGRAGWIAGASSGSSASSGAAAAAAGCGKTTEAILPYVIPPEHIVPGRGDLVRDRVPGVPGRLRGSGEEPRGPGRQAGGQPRPPGEPGRPLRPAARRASSGPTIPTASRARALREGDDLAPGVRRRRAEAPRREDRGRAPGGPGRIAMVTQLETGSLGRLMDDWLKAVGGRARRRLRAVRPRGSPGGEPGRLRDRRDPVTTRSRTPGRSCRSAPTSSRRGSRRWSTPARSAGRTPSGTSTPPA